MKWRWAVRDYDAENDDARWRAIDPQTFKSTGYSGNPELVATDSDEPTWPRDYDENGIILSAGGGEYTPYRTDVDAVLLAAAPDMLTALRLMLADFGDDYQGPTIDAARNAVAKSGRENAAVKRANDSDAKRAALAAWDDCVAARRAFLYEAHTADEIADAGHRYLQVTLGECVKHFNEGPGRVAAGW